MMLSKNFALSEFCQSQMAARMGRTIEPTEKEIANLTRLCKNVLQPIRDALTIIEPDARMHISSGLRPEFLNSALGGAKKSQHITGDASDWGVSGCSMSLFEICEMIARVEPRIEFDQLIYEGTWIHVSHSANPRGEILTAKFSFVDGHKQTDYFNGLVAD